ncbi:hypothetical protein NDU88_000618 [Pleurodeles waltl]|uniref:Uncharacterized protein n=1 Tax=Pleurodeles waltl TaxID=8319 RepID=A0AAV7LXY9_PLEWA|nr:hypothetical protein NDU88_000618 [Pleurodeles waltl]
MLSRCTREEGHRLAKVSKEINTAALKILFERIGTLPPLFDHEKQVPVVDYADPKGPGSRKCTGLVNPHGPASQDVATLRISMASSEDPQGPGSRKGADSVNLHGPASRDAATLRISMAGSTDPQDPGSRKGAGPVNLHGPASRDAATLRISMAGSTDPQDPGSRKGAGPVNLHGPASRDAATLRISMAGSTDPQDPGSRKGAGPVNLHGPASRDAATLRISMAGSTDPQDPGSRKSAGPVNLHGPASRDAATLRISMAGSTDPQDPGARKGAGPVNLHGPASRDAATLRISMAGSTDPQGPGAREGAGPVKLHGPASRDAATLRISMAGSTDPQGPGAREACTVDFHGLRFTALNGSEDSEGSGCTWCRNHKGCWFWGSARQWIHCRCALADPGGRTCRSAWCLTPHDTAALLFSILGHASPSALWPMDESALTSLPISEHHGFMLELRVKPGFPPLSTLLPMHRRFTSSRCPLHETLASACKPASSQLMRCSDNMCLPCRGRCGAEEALAVCSESFIPSADDSCVVLSAV